MSKSKIRTDKTCLNCRHVVEKRFCPNCGQENSDSRKTFHQLFIHFFEDLTHYENAFWKTIRNLIFKPGALTTEYLSGRRLSYLAPVRLYIFISFITFFLLATIYTRDTEPAIVNAKLPAVAQDSIKNAEAKLEKLIAAGILSEEEAENARKLLAEQAKHGGKAKFYLGFKSVEDLDHQYKNNSGENKLNEFQYKNLRKIIAITDKYSRAELGRKFVDALMHNFPKALFIYMPIFAFFLWLFHDKKRWYYFDHGIFTLHYFSFLLLISLVLSLFTWFTEITGNFLLLTLFDDFLTLVGMLWMIYYFFPAHHRFYRETRTVSIIKGSGLLLINLFFGSILMLAFVVYTFLTLN